MAQGYQEKHEQLISLPKEYKEFSKVFSEKEAKHFPPSREDDHAIKFKPGINPTFKCKVYPTNQSSGLAIKDWTTDMLLKGFIYPSDSPIGVATFTVKKKDGSECVV
jgi:hypothetical protein